jgi:hypothetical protein
MNGTDEAEEQLLKERARQSYIKGMLVAILREGEDLDAVARELDKLLMSGGHRFNDLEKIALGYIATFADKDVPRGQLVAIACKIRNFYYDHA